MTDPDRYREAASRVHSYDRLGRHRTVQERPRRSGHFEDSHDQFEAEVERLKEHVRTAFAPFEGDGGGEGLPPTVSAS